MGCFLAPTAEAVVTIVVTKVIKSKENKKDADELPKIKLSTKFGWLNKMLLGGSGLLAFEHLWHGEIQPTFPFLTAIENGTTAEMLAEIGTTGVTMAVAVTAVWGIMCGVATLMERKARREAMEHKEEKA